MKNFILTIMMFLFVVGFSGCGDSNNCDINPNPPKWNPPQPIDNVLLGSWEQQDINNNEYRRIIVFQENNIYLEKIVKKNGDEVYDEVEHHWSVSKDTLILPDNIDCFSNQFIAYTYKLNSDEKLLYVKLIDYPTVNTGCNCPDILIVPLGLETTFIKLADK